MHVYLSSKSKGWIRHLAKPQRAVQASAVPRQHFQSAPLPCSSSSIPLFCQHKCFLKLLMNRNRKMVWDNIFFFSPAWKNKSLYLAGKLWIEFFVSSWRFILTPALCSGRGQVPAHCSSFLVWHCLPKSKEPKKHIQQYRLHSSTFHSNAAAFILIRFTTGIWVCTEGR